MSLPDPEGSIFRESELFVEVVDGGALDRRVPGCPEWTLLELTWHLGNVQRFWAVTIRAGADVPPDSFVDEVGPSEVSELAAWMRASTRELLDALHDTTYDSPAWAWWQGDHTVRAIARHQVQEAAVHRWDAQSTVGAADPIPQPEADDGVAEFLWLSGQRPDVPAIRFTAADSGSSVGLGDEPPSVSVSASASDLVLLFYGRVEPDAVTVEGDRRVLTEFLQAVE